MSEKNGFLLIVLLVFLAFMVTSCFRTNIPEKVKTPGIAYSPPKQIAEEERKKQNKKG